MIDVIIYKNENNECVGFDAAGHAEFAEPGNDIVCAAVSVLTINTINAIEKFTKTVCSLYNDEESGTLSYRISGRPSKEAALLLETMILGLQDMADDEDYEDYIDLTFEEV